MSTKVVCEGWRDPKNESRISLVDALRRHANLSLPAAKKLLDVFSDEGRVVVELESPQRASAFVEDAEAIGVIAAILATDWPGKSGGTPT